MTGSRRRYWLILSLLAIALCALAWARLSIGVDYHWPEGNVFSAFFRVFTKDFTGGNDSVLFIRMMRLIVGIVAGVALATSGVALQGLLRNPLAEPFILGLSSGAALGFLGQQMLSKWLGHTLGQMYVGATLGAVASLWIVYLTGRRRGVIDPLGMLLTGVVLTAVNGAIIMILYQFNTVGDMAQLAGWMQGYIEESAGSIELIVITIATFAGLSLLIVKASAMDVAMFSDSEAISLGVNLPRLKGMLFVTAAVLAAGGVVLTGPVAFVGLVCPHIARLMFGPRNRMLLIASALLGAILIVSADTLAAWMQADQCPIPWLRKKSFPIGVFAALLGAPVFLSLLRRKMGRGEE
ncbi:MAG: iron ABC transporter permease [Phycisphaeraceae bacterium]